MSETSGSTPKVFISYRRSESGGHAGRLYDAMVARFGEGNVFMDVDLQPGVDFVESISAAVAACHVLLVVMGPDWTGPPAGDAQPRIADPDDFVRIEVAAALRRSDVTVVPLLVEEARMPDPGDLPEDLRALTRRHALELSDTRWRSDVGRLLDVMETLLRDTLHAPPAEPPREIAVSATPAVPAVLAKATSWLRHHSWLALAAVAVIGVLAYLLANSGSSGRPQGGDHTITDPRVPQVQPARCRFGITVPREGEKISNHRGVAVEGTACSHDDVWIFDHVDKRFYRVNEEPIKVLGERWRGVDKPIGDSHDAIGTKYRIVAVQTGRACSRALEAIRSKDGTVRPRQLGGECPRLRDVAPSVDSVTVVKSEP